MRKLTAAENISEGDIVFVGDDGQVRKISTPEPIRLWFMFDNHTFRQLSADADSALLEVMECYDRDKCGSVFGKPQSSLGEGLHIGWKEPRDTFQARAAAWLKEAFALGHVVGPMP